MTGLSGMVLEGDEYGRELPWWICYWCAWINGSNHDKCIKCDRPPEPRKMVDSDE